jgi:hypothetical protein
MNNKLKLHDEVALIPNFLGLHSYLLYPEYLLEQVVRGLEVVNWGITLISL